MENLQDYKNKYNSKNINEGNFKKKVVVCEIINNKQISKFIYKIDLKLPDKILFQPGQFINILISEKTYDPLLRRPFSIYDYNGENIISVLYQLVGKATEILKEKKGGEKISIIGPLGNTFSYYRTSFYSNTFYPDTKEGENTKNGNKKFEFINLYVAGGIGIAPILFKVKQDYDLIHSDKKLLNRTTHFQKERHTDNNNIKLYLFYGVKNYDYFLPVSFYKKYFDKIFITFDDYGDVEYIGKNKVFDKNIASITGNYSENDKFDKNKNEKENDKIKIFKNKNIIEILDNFITTSKLSNSKKLIVNKSFLCGPKPMIKAYNLLNFNFTTEVSMEAYMACGFHACLGCAILTKNGDYSYVCYDGPVFNLNELLFD